MYPGCAWVSECFSCRPGAGLAQAGTQASTASRLSSKCACDTRVFKGLVPRQGGPRPYELVRKSGRSTAEEQVTHGIPGASRDPSLHRSERIKHLQDLTN